MDPNKYKAFYEIMAIEYCPEDGECCYRDDRFLNVRLFAGKGGQKGSTILDVGCGNGYLIAPLAKGNIVYGLDISEDNIDKARSKGVKALRHDIEEPFEDGFFDVVVCSEVLEHLFFPESVLQECFRVMKAHG